jgi:hypothetical protein
VTTATLGSRRDARLVLEAPPPAGRGRARRTLLGEVGLLLVSLVFAAPAVLAAAGYEQAWLAVATRSHLAREITGFAGVFVVLAQISLTAGKRFSGLSARTRRWWLQVHRLTGPLLLLVVAIHTGGKSGGNANALLWASLCAMLALAQCGHVFKAYVRMRAQPPASPAALSLDEVANTETGWVHLAGYHTHVVLALVVTLLLGAHVFCVYFY